MKYLYPLIFSLLLIAIETEAQNPQITTTRDSLGNVGFNISTNAQTIGYSRTTAQDLQVAKNAIPLDLAVSFTCEEYNVDSSAWVVSKMLAHYHNLPDSLTFQSAIFVTMRCGGFPEKYTFAQDTLPAYLSSLSKSRDYAGTPTIMHLLFRGPNGQVYQINDQLKIYYNWLRAPKREFDISRIDQFRQNGILSKSRVLFVWVETEGLLYNRKRQFKGTRVDTGFFPCAPNYKLTFEVEYMGERVLSQPVIELQTLPRL